MMLPDPTAEADRLIATRAERRRAELLREARLLDQMRHDPKVSVRRYAARACSFDWAALAAVLDEEAAR